MVMEIKFTDLHCTVAVVELYRTCTRPVLYPHGTYRTSIKILKSAYITVLCVMY